ncbi:ATP-binding cassette domain-containing protein [Paenibacillus sp. GCM10027627]|uniref:ATP-binding cassette domain-containing protein n=1 Tax=unclassified Paenibacillus TaxID=185978 RepID=UPI0036252232
MADNWILDRLAVGPTGQKQEGTLLLEDVSLSFAAGTITLLIGHNGSGKSTLLESMAGLRELQSGHISLGEDPLWIRKRRKKLNRNVLLQLGISMQQSESQWFSSTVYEEMLYSMRPYKLEPGERERRTYEALGAVGLHPDMMERNPWTLSGGQQRRLALACLLACEPDWLLLDEPTAGLDAGGISRLCAVLAAHREAGRGAVVATHDLEALLPLADAVVVVRDGKVREAAPAEAAETLGPAAPQALRAGALLREAAALPPEAAAGRGGGALWQSPQEMAAAIAANISHSEQSEHPAADVKRRGTVDRAAQEQFKPAAGQVKSERKPWLRSDHYDPRALVAAYFMLTASILWLGSIAGLGLSAFVVAAAIAPFWPLVRGMAGIIRGFAIITAILIAIGGTSLSPLQFQWSSAEPTAIRLLQLLLIMVAGMPMLALMTPLRLQRAIQQTFGWTARFGLPIHTFGLLITLIFRFIPLLSREWGRFSKIAHARGKSAARIGAIPIPMLRIIFIPFIRAILRMAEGMADALEARGYGSMPRKATYGFRVRFRKQDFLLIVAAGCGGLLILAFGSFL